jgi:hypothetical protein
MAIEEMAPPSLAHGDRDASAVVDETRRSSDESRRRSRTAIEAFAPPSMAEGDRGASAAVDGAR